MEVLRLKNISKRFEGLQALSNVSFTIEEGERWGIIGPNGSGKTTLLNIISGLLRPTSGRVYLFGKEVTHKPLHAFTHLGLARTFQLNTLFLSLSVLDNVVLAIQGIRPFRYGIFRPLSSYHLLFEQAKEILVRWNLWERRDFQVRDLSYGEQRCLELILGLISNPKVILFDEPTAGISVQEVGVFTKAIKDLLPDITVVIVEHNIKVMFELAEYIIVLNHGEIISRGEKESIKADRRVREVYLGPEK